MPENKPYVSWSRKENLKKWTAMENPRNESSGNLKDGKTQKKMDGWSNMERG